MLNKYHFVGKLTLSSRIDKIDYGIIVKSSYDISFNSITEILNDIYKSESPFVSVKIKQINNTHKISRSGKLNISPDEYGVLSYHVGDFSLELELDERVGQEISIYIEHLEEKEIKYKKVSEEAS